MPDTPQDLEFLHQITATIEENLADEQFGVTELAGKMNMSRSNLLRRVKKSTSLPVNQLIRDARLKRAMELLKNSSFNVSEISHRVGFGSTSYFIKCFREHYGYPPGEQGRRSQEGLSTNSLPQEPADALVPIEQRVTNHVVRMALVAMVMVVVVAIGIVGYTQWINKKAPLEKSIAVLPFKNDSNDSSNVYLINGLMESTLNNLQNIKTLRVISRTSAEKYRNTTKSIPEMAKELNVSYLVEGSGQKIGEEILLNIQLIEAASDKHLWAKQYKRKAQDIFELQREIARNIANEIEVIITPDAARQMEKKPTENLAAYDYYLKGKQLSILLQEQNLRKAEEYFKKAIELDDHFALAYAHLVIVYYYLDAFQINKQYTREISAYADKAMLLDSQSGESLIAKALDYAHQKEYKSAVQYLEKALEYHPDSGLVYYFLTEFYSIYVPDPERYLEYALRGAQVDVIASDSDALSFKYFHVSNAYMQTGFIDEGIKYLDKSLAYNPQSYFAKYAGILFRFTKNHDAKRARDLLIAEYERDTNRIDIAKEIGRISYLLKDNENAFKYYQIFLTLRERFQLEIYQEDFLDAGIVYTRKGLKKEGEACVKRYKDFADQDKTIYRPLWLSMYYVYTGDDKKALEYLAQFSKEDKYVYWVLLMENDPMLDHLKKNPEFQKVVKEIKDKFWRRNKEIKAHMEEKGLM